MENLSDVIIKEWAESLQYSPDANFYETEVGYIVHFNCAGVFKHNIECFIRHGYVYVQFERNEPYEGKLRLNEIKYGKYQRRLKLSNKCDMAQMKTHYENGIFQVLIPKLQ